MTLITSDGGLTEDFPDDTVLAFVAAVAEDADRLELDVQYTRDGHLVVHHPTYLGQVKTAPQYPSTRHAIPPSATTVGDLTLEELRTYDAGSWAGAEHAGTQMPTLVEVLDACPGVGYELDLKTPSRAFVADVVDLARDRNLLGEIEFTSGQHFILSEVRRIEPSAEIGTFHYGYPEWADSRVGEQLVLGELEVGGVRVMHCALALLNESFVAEVRSRGHLVYASNCETEEQLRGAFSLGVDRLSTTHLRLALQVRASEGGDIAHATGG